MRTSLAARCFSGALVLAAVGCGGHGGGGGGGGNPKTPTGFCSVDQWCYQNPIPQGEDLASVSVLPDGTAFAAGNDGEILHYAGGVWSEMSTVGVGNLSAIRAFDDSHAIAVGYNGVYWWDGTSWTADATFPAYGGNGIWASTPADVWILDDNGNAYRWDGQSWSTETITPSIGGGAAISGKSDTDLWAAGSNGIAHRTGTAAWVTTNLGTYLYFQAIAEVAPNDVWAGSQSAGIYHYDGSHWSLYDSNPYYVTGMFAADATHVYAAAEDPGLLMWNGSSWSSVGGGGYGGFYDLEGVGMRTATDGWAVGYHGTLVRLSGGNGTEISSDVGGGSTVSSLSIVSANEIWAGDENSNDVIRWDGSKWTEMNTGNLDSPQGIYAAAHDDVYAGSHYNAGIWHYDGTTWTAQASSPNIDATWGTGHSDVYASGIGGYLAHYDGSNWTPVAGASSNELFGIGGSGAGDVYVVGAQNTLLHGSGTSFTKLDAGIAYPVDFYGVWAASATDVFVVGNGVILHGNAGAGWTPETLPSADTYVYWRAIWGTSVSDIWAVSEEGLILHKDATGWTEKKSPSHLGLESVAGAGKDVWASGRNGVILHYRAP